MRIRIAGTVQQVLPRMKDDKPVVTSTGKPVNDVYLVQNGAGRAPEIAKVRYYGVKVPKVGDKFDSDAVLEFWKMDNGRSGVTVKAFE